MAEITAAVVMKLRKISGQGMMDCKKALAETNGDLDEALALLRKKGLATLAKRAGRDTTEGRVVYKKSDDGKTVAMATLCCETDFASKSDDFVEAAGKLADYAMVCSADEGIEALAETEIDGKKFSELLTDMVSKTCEKTELGEFARMTVSGTGVIGAYVHFNNKIGALVEIEASSDEAAAGVAEVAEGIAMHVTAMNPAGCDKDSIDPAVLEKEREIAKEQVKDKPAEIIDKIVEGKIGRFLKDNCLIFQTFVKDDSMSVQDALAKAAKTSGGEAKVKRFIRFEIG